ncbi:MULTISPECIES: DUF4232 domain-containing protein [Streptomyces]|uniref:DUF4232 domain-containing protein n=1 Tax=Streptomyces katrae TaxID=68223 RepID=A0ABT7GU27_9ACTN|nr:MULTISPECIES: DUF4232 domain-containing protein [Streptomyces]MDK9496746.1 DUF4232 domain-containing protein [Streptomyces katrae]GLX19116.1 hypothetical protein Slala01_27600 [Streptomyces lavendulae subsp. lavendulae]GLX25836.1 hypothetical protein Slala02_16560 [Streptomyces lavendulae subsp. lavendulae]
MSTARNRWQTYALGAAAVAALLTSTACDSGKDDGKNPAATASPSASASAPASPGASAAPGTSPSASASTSPGGKASPSPSGSAAPTADAKPAARACSHDDLSITPSLWKSDSGQNLLITAANISGTACTLYHYPYVGFGTVVAGPLPPLGSAPSAAATLQPREKAYAGVYMYRGGERTVAVTALSMGYQDRAPGSNKDSAWLEQGLAAYTGDLNVGRGAKVTYWNKDLRAVEDQLFRPGKG